MHVPDVGRRVAIRDLSYLFSSHLRNLVQSAIPRHCLEEGVYHGVGVSLSALYCESAMEEAGVSKHFPDNRMTPIVGLLLWVDCDTEIVVAGLENLRDGHHLVQRDADQVLSQLLEGDFKSCFIILALAHGIADDTITISNKKKHSSGVNSVESGHISDRVGVNKYQSEVSRVEYFIVCRGEEPFGTRLLMLLLTGNSLIVHVDVGVSLSHRGRLCKLLFLHLFVVAFQVPSPSELLKHDHLIFAFFRCLLKKTHFLLLLREIDYVCPALLILGLEILQELIEPLVSLSHALDGLVK